MQKMEHFCSNCNSIPCFATTNEVLNVIYEATQNSAMNDKQRRFLCYKTFSHILGFTFRQPLPDCVLGVVRNKFPDGPIKGYMEFK